MLGDGDGAPGDGEVVIGGEEGDQAKSEATDGLGEAEPIETEILQVRKVRELIEKEIEQLDHENAIEGALSDSIRRLCFPPESSSIPQTPTAPNCKPS